MHGAQIFLRPCDHHLVSVCCVCRGALAIYIVRCAIDPCCLSSLSTFCSVVCARTLHCPYFSICTALWCMWMCVRVCVCAICRIFSYALGAFTNHAVESNIYRKTTNEIHAGQWQQQQRWWRRQKLATTTKCVCVPWTQLTAHICVYTAPSAHTNILHIWLHDELQAQHEPNGTTISASAESIAKVCMCYPKWERTHTHAHDTNNNNGDERDGWFRVSVYWLWSLFLPSSSL